MSVRLSLILLSNKIKNEKKTIIEFLINIHYNFNYKVEDIKGFDEKQNG